MEPSRLTQLPTDLIDLLAGRLDLRTLQETYQTQPALRQLDPNHRIWKNLYHRYLSPYSLPEGTSYRDEFFKGMALADAPLTRVQLIKLYAQLGYTIPLEALYSQLPLGSLMTISTLAVENGYLEMVKSAFNELKKPSQLTTTQWIQHVYNLVNTAIQTGRLDMVDYILLELALAGGDPEIVSLNRLRARVELGDMPLDYYGMNQVRMNYLVRAAARSEDHPFERVQQILSHMQPTQETYTAGLEGAVESANIRLMDWMTRQGAKLSGYHYSLAAKTRNPAIYQWILDHLNESPARYLHSIIATDDVDLLDFVLNYTIRRWPSTVTPDIWADMLSRAKSVPMLEYLLNHPQFRLHQKNLQEKLYHLAATFNGDPQLFQALYQSLDWSHDDVFGVLSILPPDRTLNDYHPALTMFQVLLFNEKWTQDELLHLLRYTIGRGSRAHIDALLSVMRYVPADTILALVDDVETHGNSHHNAVQRVTHVQPTLIPNAITDDIRYIRDEMAEEVDADIYS